MSVDAMVMVRLAELERAQHVAEGRNPRALADGARRMAATPRGIWRERSCGLPQRRSITDSPGEAEHEAAA
jgi:hypothetical protein